MVKTKKYLASVQKNRNKSIKRNKKSLRRNRKSLRRNRKSLRRNRKSLKGGKSIRRNRSKRRQFKKTKIQTGGGSSPLSFLLELDPANCTKIKGIYFLWDGNKDLSIVKILSLKLTDNKVNYGEVEGQNADSRTENTIKFLKGIKFVIIEKKDTTTTLITNMRADTSGYDGKPPPPCSFSHKTYFSVKENPKAVDQKSHHKILAETYGGYNTILGYDCKIGLFKFTFIDTAQTIPDVKSALDSFRAGCENFLKIELKVLGDEVLKFLMYIELSKPKDGFSLSKCLPKAFRGKKMCIMNIEINPQKYTGAVFDLPTIQQRFNEQYYVLEKTIKSVSGKPHADDSLVEDGAVASDQSPSWVVPDPALPNNGTINLNLIKIRGPLTLAPLVDPNPSSLEVLMSSIGHEIMHGSSDHNVVGRMVVLPSQLNGAEYPSKTSIATEGNWESMYFNDGTGGPRGQLTGSLELAEKIVVEASNDNNPNGINYIRYLEIPLEINLKNGYLEIDPKINQATADKFCESLKDMSCLVSEGNIPSGYYTLERDIEVDKHRLTMKHGYKKVDMVYASGCPLNCRSSAICTNSENYQLGPTPSTPEQKQIANCVLFRQYLIALTQACQFVRERAEFNTPGKFYEVLCMPLGGGVFGNNQMDITKQYNRAIETVKINFPDDYTKLKIKMLFWDGGTDLATFKNTGAMEYFKQPEDTKDQNVYEFSHDSVTVVMDKEHPSQQSAREGYLEKLQLEDEPPALPPRKSVHSSKLMKLRPFVDFWGAGNPFEFEYDLVIPGQNPNIADFVGKNDRGVEVRPQKMMSDDPRFVAWNDKNPILKTGDRDILPKMRDQRMLIFIAAHAPELAINDPYFVVKKAENAGYGAKSRVDWKGDPWTVTVRYDKNNELMYDNKYTVTSPSGQLEL